MNIAVLHRYPPAQVIGTNASFIAFLEKLIEKKHVVYYLTYKDKVTSEKIEKLNYVELPFTFNRGDSKDKLVKTILWMGLAPIYVTWLGVTRKIDLIYCDDSVPYYGFVSKIVNPLTKVVIRLGDLQIGYKWADTNPPLFNWALKMETLMWRCFDGLIPISNEFKKFLTELGVDEKKMRVVEESINLSKEMKAEEKISSGSVTFMFHGALLSCKGLDTLVKAFRIVNKEMPKTKLIIAGGGEEEIKIKNLVNELEIRNVEFTGWYDHLKLEKLMTKSDIGVIMRSSNMANNFVVTTCLLENWSYKKPVLVPRLKSFEGVIKNKESGVFFEPGNSNDLAAKMMDLANNRKLWTKLGKNGYDISSDIFDHKKIADKMVTALESFI